MTTPHLAWLRVAWIVATLALAALWRGEALLLLVPLALLGPLVREVAPPPDRDERQRLEDYRASHLALMAVFAVLFLLGARGLLVDGTGLTGEWLALLAVPLVVRMGVSLGRGLGARRAGVSIGAVTGGVWLGLAVVSHGLSAAAAGESLVGGSLLAATAVSLRWPRAGGGLLTLAGLALLILMVAPAARGGAWGQALGMTATLATPAFVAGLLLVASSRRSPVQADEFADLRAPVKR